MNELGVICIECEDHILDPSKLHLHWQEVIGFERKRDQGGTNHIALRKPTGRYMCRDCMARLQANVSPAQMSL